MSFKKRKAWIILCSAVAVVLIAAALCGILLFHKTEMERVADAAAKYVVDNTSAEYGNEWAAITLARGQYACAKKWLSEYRVALEKEVKICEGNLSENAYTVYSRCAICCNMLGHDAKSVGGYDILSYTADTDKVMSHGINGGVFALIALDVCGGNEELIDEYVEILLSRQHQNGAFGMSENIADVDVTAMVLQALSMHTDRDDVREAVEKAVNALSAVQKPCGGFATMGEINSQSISQVILALDALDIPLDDPRFVKNGNTLLSALMTYRCENGGFKRMLTDEEPMLSATLQALQALTAINMQDHFYVKR